MRIRSARAGDTPKIDNLGSDTSPRYAVTGVLSQDRRLVLPGLTMRYGQRQELATWLDKLRSGGGEAVTATTGAFGLTATQLESLRDAPKRPVLQETKDRPLTDLVRHVQQITQLPVELDATARQAISNSSRVLDELQGLSCGTALAVATRPYGVLVAPAAQGPRAVALRSDRAPPVPTSRGPSAARSRAGCSRQRPTC